MKIDWEKVWYDTTSNGFKVSMLIIFVMLSTSVFIEAFILFLMWRAPNEVGIIGRILGMMLLTGIPLMRAIWRNRQ